MRTFENYYEIFKVRHSDDRDFPLLQKASQKESIEALKEYFEDFWNEAERNSAEDSKSQNAKLENENIELNLRIRELEDMLLF